MISEQEAYKAGDDLESLIEKRDVHGEPLTAEEIERGDADCEVLAQVADENPALADAVAESEMVKLENAVFDDIIGGEG